MVVGFETTEMKPAYLQMNLPDTLKSAFAAVLNTLLPGIPSTMGRIDLYVLTTVTFRCKKPIRSL